MQAAPTNQFINKSLALLWRSVAVCLVLVAVLLSALRLAIPHVGHINTHLTQFLSQQLNARVSIGQLSGSWDSAGPAFILSNVHIEDDANNVFSVAELEMSFSVLDSLQQLTLVTHEFSLQGAQLDLHTTQDDDGDNDMASLTRLLRTLFIEQLNYFAIQDMQLHIHQAQRSFIVELVDIRWLNRDNKHSGKGFIRPLSGTSQQDNFAALSIALSGGADNLAGTIYAQAQGFPLAPMRTEISQAFTIDTPKSAAGELWISLDNNRVQRIQGHLATDTLALTYQPTDGSSMRRETSLSHLAFALNPHVSHWQLDIPEIQLQTDTQSVNAALSGKVLADGRLELDLTTPVALDQLASILPFVGPDQSLPVQAISGRLSGLSIRKNSDLHYQAALSLTGLGWQSTSIVGANELTLDLDWQQQGTQQIIGLDLNGASEQLLTKDTLLADNLSYDELEVALQASHTSGQRWQLNDAQLRLASDMLDANVRASFVDTLRVSAELAPDTVTNIVALLPTKLMGKDTYAYLRRALSTPTQAGVVTDATLSWNGHPQDFPFTEPGTGEFVAQVSIRDAEFAFAREWPMLSELDIDLTFRNDDLLMTAPRAKLLNVDVAQMQATIPGLRSDSILTIEASAAGSGFALTEVMQQSMLNNSLGRVLSENVIVSNALATDLNLHIPLTGRDVVATGELHFDDNYILLADIDTNLTKVNGSLQFVNEQISAQGLTARLLDQPVDIALALDASKDGYGGDIALAGDFALPPLAAQLHPDYESLVSGGAKWDAKVALDFPTGKDFAYRVDLNAALDNAIFDLPMPFAQHQELTFSMQGAAQFSQVNLQVDDNIHFSGTLPHAERQFSRAHLRLGDMHMQNIGTGFSIAAGVDHIDSAHWYRIIDTLITATGAAKKPLFSAPERIFIAATTASVAGQVLHDIDAQVKQQSDNWQLRLNATETRAKVNFYNDWLGAGIAIDADFITLPQWQHDDAASSSDVQIDWAALELPPLTFSCQRCDILANQLGQVNLKIDPISGGMAINQLQISTNTGTLNASGTWQYATDSALGFTELSGQLDASDFGEFLQGFQFDSGIVDSSAEFSFDLRWQDSPIDFNFANLYGDVAWELSDGYLTEVSDKGSRIFTLVSLDSLIRKLSLDFRDVFAQGFFYDEIAGTLSIEQGVANTQDTVVDGGAGEIEITGFSDLVAQELNYNVSFTPDVTGNLPALMYFMVSPPTAIAAIAVNQVLTEAKVFSNINYAVKGPFDEPIITELGRTSADIQLPARIVNPLPLDPERPLSAIDGQGLPMLTPAPSRQPELPKGETQ